MASVPARVVTIVTIYAAEHAVTEELAALGVTGFTVNRANGVGRHGAQHGGLFTAENYTFVIVVPPAVATHILAWVDGHLVKTHPAIAYAYDVEAVPGDHFR